MGGRENILGWDGEVNKAYDWTLALVRIPWPYVVSCRLQKLAIRDFLEKLHQTLVVTLASNFAN
jgi:hypothetical protein